MHDTSEDKDHHVNSSGLVLQKNIIKDIFDNEVCALTPFVNCHTRSPFAILQF